MLDRLTAAAVGCLLIRLEARRRWQEKRISWIGLQCSPVFPNTHIAMVFDAIFELTGEALAEGDKLTRAQLRHLHGLRTPGAPGRNPSTGETITISASRSVAFKVSKNLKDRLLIP